MENKKTLTLAITSISLMVFSTQVQAVEVPFAGTVTSACALVVSSPGIFGVNAGGNVLSSKEAGGLSGSVLATATGPDFDITVSSPAAFSLIPPGATADATFISTYSTSGATTTPETDEANATTLNSGITNVSVDLEATKTSGVYTSGLYEADVTVTCE